MLPFLLSFCFSLQSLFFIASCAENQKLATELFEFVLSTVTTVLYLDYLISTNNFFILRMRIKFRQNRKK